MKAIVQDRYGDPDETLAVAEVDAPRVAPGEVLVRVRGAAVAGDDWHLLRGLPYVARLKTGMRRPKNRVPGRDVAGVVEEVGGEVAAFKPGDEVFGWCDGAFAEQVCVSEGALAPKPANLDLSDASAVPVSGFTALQAVRDKGQVKPGDAVLVIGASGGVGTLIVQIARAFGGEVTAVCRAAGFDLVRALGATHVVDYTQDDFTGTGTRYDVIIDLVGSRSIRELRSALTSGGTLVMVGGSGGRWFKGTHRFLAALALSPFVRQRLRPIIHRDSQDDLLALKELIESGAVVPVVSARYPLAQVSQALHHFEGGHARGKVVLTV